MRGEVSYMVFFKSGLRRKTLPPACRIEGRTTVNGPGRALWPGPSCCPLSRQDAIVSLLWEREVNVGLPTKGLKTARSGREATRPWQVNGV